MAKVPHRGFMSPLMYQPDAKKGEFLKEQIGKKFQAWSTALQKEDFLDKMQLLAPERKKILVQVEQQNRQFFTARIKKMRDEGYFADMSDAQIKQLYDNKFSRLLVKESYKNAKREADEKVVQMFLSWLNGSGTPEELKKTPWGKLKLAYEIPEVRAWVGSFIDIMHDTKLKLFKLVWKGPKTLNDYWIYWKFVIHADSWDEEDPFYFTFIANEFYGIEEIEGKAGQSFLTNAPFFKPGPDTRVTGADDPRNTPLTFAEVTAEMWKKIAEKIAATPVVSASLATFAAQTDKELYDEEIKNFTGLMTILKAHNDGTKVLGDPELADLKSRLFAADSITKNLEAMLKLPPDALHEEYRKSKGAILKSAVIDLTTADFKSLTPEEQKKVEEFEAAKKREEELKAEMEKEKMTRIEAEAEKQRQEAEKKQKEEEKKKEEKEHERETRRIGEDAKSAEKLATPYAIPFDTPYYADVRRVTHTVYSASQRLAMESDAVFLEHFDSVRQDLNEQLHVVTRELTKLDRKRTDIRYAIGEMTPDLNRIIEFNERSKDRLLKIKTEYGDSSKEYKDAEVLYTKSVAREDALSRAVGEVRNADGKLKDLESELTDDYTALLNEMEAADEKYKEAEANETKRLEREAALKTAREEERRKEREAAQKKLEMEKLERENPGIFKEIKRLSKKFALSAAELANSTEGMNADDTFEAMKEWMEERQIEEGIAAGKSTPSSSAPPSGPSAPPPGPTGAPPPGSTGSPPPPPGPTGPAVIPTPALPTKIFPPTSAPKTPALASPKTPKTVFSPIHSVGISSPMKKEPDRFTIKSGDMKNTVYTKGKKGYFAKMEVPPPTWDSKRPGELKAAWVNNDGNPINVSDLSTMATNLARFQKGKKPVNPDPDNGPDAVMDPSQFLKFLNGAGKRQLVNMGLDNALRLYDWDPENRRVFLQSMDLLLGLRGSGEYYLTRKTYPPGKMGEHPRRFGPAYQDYIISQVLAKLRDARFTPK